MPVEVVTYTEFYVFKKFVRTMESLKVRNAQTYCSDFVRTWYPTSNFRVRLVISYGSLSKSSSLHPL